MKNQIRNLIVLTIVSTILFSCTKEDPEPDENRMHFSPSISIISVNCHEYSGKLYINGQYGALHDPIIRKGLVYIIKDEIGSNIPVPTLNDGIFEDTTSLDAPLGIWNFGYWPELPDAIGQYYIIRAFVSSAEHMDFYSEVFVCTGGSITIEMYRLPGDKEILIGIVDIENKITNQGFVWSEKYGDKTLNISDNRIDLGNGGGEFRDTFQLEVNKSYTFRSFYQVDDFTAYSEIDSFWVR